MNSLIIHYVFRPKGSDEWVVAYEIKGEWKPRNALLVDLITNDFCELNMRTLETPGEKVLSESK